MKLSQNIIVYKMKNKRREKVVVQTLTVHTSQQHERRGCSPSLD